MKIQAKPIIVLLIKEDMSQLFYHHLSIQSFFHATKLMAFVENCLQNDRQYVAWLFT